MSVRARARERERESEFDRGRKVESDMARRTSSLRY